MAMTVMPVVASSPQGPLELLFSCDVGELSPHFASIFYLHHSILRLFVKMVLQK
jgi:hypothetical protein